MKTKFILLLTLSIILSLGSCVDGKKKNADTTAGQNEFIKIRVDDYEISLPSDMQKTTGLNSDASLQYQNIHKELYTIVIDEPKKEFIAALSELGYEEKFSIAFYRDIQLKRLSDRMHITHQSNISSMTINGLKSETVDIDAKVDNIEAALSYFLTFIESENNNYMVMSWTLKSKKQEYKKTFETIAQSFKIKE